MAVGLLGCVASPTFAKQPIWLLYGRVGVELRPASLIVNRGILRAALHFLHLVAPGLIVRARLSRPLFECQIFIIPELLANYLFQQRSELARLRHLARRLGTKLSQSLHLLVSHALAQVVREHLTLSLVCQHFQLLGCAC